MSDTPRTDAAIQKSCIDDLKCEWVEVGFARQLEHDLNVANNWIEHHQDHVDDLIKENATLRADKERLDWLARNRSVSIKERPLFVTPESLRAAIDAARKEAQP